MKTLEQILLYNPPFRLDFSTDTTKMRFMFLLEDGRLIGDAGGETHSVLMGWNPEDVDIHELQRSFCEQNKALRVCFQPFSVKDDGTRGNFWSVYVEIDGVSPTETQWTTLSDLYQLKGWRDTIVIWDIYAPETDRGWIHGEGSLSDLRLQIFPASPTEPVKKKRKRKRKKNRRRSRGN